MKLSLWLGLILSLIKVRSGSKHRDSSSSSDSSNFHDDDYNYISPQQILNSNTISSFIGFTRGQWKNIKPMMHPTQPDIGFAWMIRKLCSDFDSAENAQIEMKPIWADKWPNIDRSDLLETGNTVPVIIGPSGPNTEELVFYVIDSHHTLSALDYSGYDSTWVYINILNDLRMLSYEAFIFEMKHHKRTYLYGQKGTKKELPQLIDFDDLPNTFGTLGDSTWRSLGGYSRKVKIAPPPFPQCNENEGHYKYCMRPFVRICGDDGYGIPFYEFMWGYFYVEATYFETIYWPAADYDTLNVFIDVYDDLLDKYYDDDGDFIDPQIPEQCDEVVEDWLYAASLLIPLARNNETAEYSPIGYFELDTLPGYIKGPQFVDEDPDCDFNTEP